MPKGYSSKGSWPIPNTSGGPNLSVTPSDLRDLLPPFPVIAFSRPGHESGRQSDTHEGKGSLIMYYTSYHRFMCEYIIYHIIVFYI